uniref:Uncharacterized protein n=1 Tax=Caenorhabditis japonica TaxID=281687 RepID=A0A8R1EGR3_CAEJA
MNADPFSITSKKFHAPSTRDTWIHIRSDMFPFSHGSTRPPYKFHAGVDPRRPTPKQSTLPPRGRVDLYRIIYGSNPRPIRFGSVLALSPTTCV